MKRFLLLHFPKIAPSSLPNRRVHSQIESLRFFVGRPLRLPPVPTLWFHATSPVYSSSILSALLQRLTTLGFIVVSLAPPEPKFFWPLLAKLRDSRDACSALRSFPSADGCDRWTLRRQLAMRAVHAGRFSPPARSSPCSAARLAPSLEACGSLRPEGPLNPRPNRSRAPKVHRPPYRLVVQSHGKSPSHPTATSRFFSIVGSVARSPFPASVPGAPVGLGSSRFRGEESVRQR